MIKKNFYNFFVQFSLLTFCFSIGRVFFMCYNWSFFKIYPASELLLSLIHGIRFDLVVLGMTMGIIHICLFIAGNWSQNIWLNRILSWTSLFLILFYLAVFVADLGYYAIIKRHISFEITLVLHDLPGAVRQAISGYTLLVIGLFAAIILVSRSWFKLWNKLQWRSDEKAPLWKHILSTLIIIVLVVLMARGGLQSKPTNEKFAFRNSSVQLGNLTLNAPYTVMRMLVSQRVEELDLINQDDAIKRVRNLVADPGDKFLDPAYPLMRRSNYSSPANGPIKNIVFIMQEGIPALWTGSFNPERAGDTPNMDKLAEKGLKFTRFIGNGTYTTQGFGASIASVPALPGLTLIDSSFVQNKLSSIPAILSERGFNTLFVSGYFDGSASIDSFMQLMGMKKLIEQSNFKNYKKISDTWGIWDEYTYQRFYEEIKKEKEPFFALVEPCTTHSPHDVPSEKWLHYKEGVEQKNWRNALRYSDWSLGEFFKKAETLDNFKNTLFIITSDHVSKIDPEDIIDSARIPLIFYTPGGQIKPGINDTVASQTDLIPTIMDLMRINTTHASLGRSLFRKKREEGIALHYTGNFLYWFQNNTVTRFTNLEADGHYNLDQDWKNENNLIEKIDKNKLKEIQKNFRSYIQITQNALINNNIIK